MYRTLILAATALQQELGGALAQIESWANVAMGRHMSAEFQLVFLREQEPQQLWKQGKDSLGSEQGMGGKQNI